MLLYYPSNTYWKSNSLNQNHPYGKEQEQFNLFWLIENLPKGHFVDVNYLYCDSVYNQSFMIYSCVMTFDKEWPLKKGYCMRWRGLFRATKEQIRRPGKLKKDIAKTIIT